MYIFILIRSAGFSKWRSMCLFTDFSARARLLNTIISLSFEATSRKCLINKHFPMCFGNNKYCFSFINLCCLIFLLSSEVISLFCLCFCFPAFFGPSPVLYSFNCSVKTGERDFAGGSQCSYLLQDRSSDCPYLVLKIYLADLF